MPSIGFGEILVIVLVALIVFGPKRLPEIGRTVGKSVREFRRATSDLRSQIESDIEPDVEPPTVPSPAARRSSGSDAHAPAAGTAPAPGPSEPAAREPDQGGRNFD